MLEIIALVFLTKNIGKLAEEKGQPSGKWKAFTVIAWFVCEIIGIAIIMSIVSDNLLIAIVFGLLSAFGGYLLVKSQLEKYPDVMNDMIERIGEDEDFDG